MGNAPFPLSDANGFYSFGSGSNLRTGSNPSYAVSDFLAFYPQFGNDSQGNPLIPTDVIQSFIDVANATTQQTRWRSYWNLGMAWFVAHFCTLYLQPVASTNTDAATVYEAGRAQGITTSESIGDISFSQETITDDADMWDLTVYGQQRKKIAKFTGIGGSYVW